MICPKCQKGIPEGSKFCLECGSNLSAISGLSGTEEDISTFQSPTFETKPGESKQTGDESLDKVRTIPGPRKSVKKSEISQGVPLSVRYQIIEEIGKGGFAVVYKARDKNLDRIVAVKRLLAEHLTNSRARQTLERFDREAHAIANLNHRNIVRVHDYGYDSEGPYIVMECVEEGDTLRDFLKKKGRLSVPESMKLIRGVCQGLSFAHKRNLVHRDIKPANILLEREGDDFVPKIVDFGLARIGYDSTTSMTGYGMGTPYYMPPEQRRDAKNVNHTADIYALGKTIYEMVTGEIPDNVDPEMIPPPPQLAKIIIKCIKSRPEDRYFSIDELLKSLDEIHVGASPTVISKAAAASGNVCPNCYVGNPEDVKFCESCGTGLTQLCPECERENSVYKQFCGGCGTDIKGFLQAQESLQQMEKHKSEKKWSRVTKEFGLLPENLHLPGTEGQHLINQLQELNDEAESLLKERDKLAKQIDRALKSEKWQRALALVTDYKEIDPHKAEINELPALIETRIDDHDYAIACEQASQFESEEKLKEAIQVCEEYLQKHPNGVHTSEIKQKVSRYKKISKLLRRTQNILKQAQFGDLELVVKEIEGSGANPQLISSCRSQIKNAQESYSSTMAKARTYTSKKDLDNALKAAEYASDLCPKSTETKKLLTSIQNNRNRVVKLIESSTVNIQKTQFVDAAKKLQEVRSIWPMATGLKEAELELTKTKSEFEMFSRRARSMIDSKNLDSAMKILEHALILCPDSEEAKTLVESVKHKQNQAREYLNEAKKKLEQAKYRDCVLLSKKALACWANNEEAKQYISNANALAHLCPKAASLEKKREWKHAGRLYRKIDELSGNKETQGFLERKKEVNQKFTEALSKEVSRSIALACLGIALLIYYTFVFADCLRLPQRIPYLFLWISAGLVVGIAQFRILKVILGPAPILLVPLQAVLFLVAYFYGVSKHGDISAFSIDCMLIPLFYASVMTTGSLLLVLMISWRDLLRNIFFSFMWFIVFPAAWLCWNSLSAGINLVTEQLILINEFYISHYILYSASVSLISLAFICLVTCYFAGKVLIVPLYSSAINKMNQTNAYLSFIPFLMAMAGCTVFFFLILPPQYYGIQPGSNVFRFNILMWAIGAGVLSFALALIRFIKPNDCETEKDEKASTNSEDKRGKPDRLIRLFTEVPLIAVSGAALGAGVSYLCKQFGDAIILPNGLGIFKSVYIIFIGICALSFVFFIITGAMKTSRLLAIFSLPIGFIVIYLMKGGINSLGWAFKVDWLSITSPEPGIKFLPLVLGSLCAGLLIPKPILHRPARMGGVSIGILAVLILCFGIVVAHRFNSEFKSATQRELNTAYQQMLQNPANASLWKNMAFEYARIGAIGNARACFAVASLDEGRNSEIREDMCDFSRVPEILSRIEKTGGQLESYWIEKLSRNAREKNMPSLASSLEVFRS